MVGFLKEITYRSDYSWATKRESGGMLLYYKSLCKTISILTFLTLFMVSLTYKNAPFRFYHYLITVQLYQAFMYDI